MAGSLFRPFVASVGTTPLVTTPLLTTPTQETAPFWSAGEILEWLKLPLLFVLLDFVDFLSFFNVAGRRLRSWSMSWARRLTKGAGKCAKSAGGFPVLFVLCVERPFSPWSQLAPGGQENEAGGNPKLALLALSIYPISSPGGTGGGCADAPPKISRERERESSELPEKAPLAGAGCCAAYLLFRCFVILHTCGMSFNFCRQAGASGQGYTAYRLLAASSCQMPRATCNILVAARLIMRHKKGYQGCIYYF